MNKCEIDGVFSKWRSMDGNLLGKRARKIVVGNGGNS